MEAKLRTLQSLYNIVKDDPDPTTYPCSFRELIIKGRSDASILHEHLEQLSAEGFTIVKKLDQLVICITPKGIQIIKELQMLHPAPLNIL